MNYFNLECGYPVGCNYLDLELNSASINDLSIECSNENSCQYSTFNITSDVDNDFDFLCESTGCYDLNISIASTYINSLLWSCTDSTSCFSAEMVFINDVVISSLTRECQGNSSCFESSLTSTTNSAIGNLVIDCTDCEYMTVSTQISNSATIQCKDDGACQYVDIQLEAVAADVNFDVTCLTSSASIDKSSCTNGNFKFYGYSDSGNFSLVCGQYDCYNAYFYGYNLDYGGIKCPFAS